MVGAIKTGLPKTLSLAALSFLIALIIALAPVTWADGRGAFDSLKTDLGPVPDFSLTERHVVFYDLPVTFDLERAGATPELGYEPHAAEETFEALIAAEKNILLLRELHPTATER